MNELSNFLVETIIKEAIGVDKTIVVYAGRFQPFHKGHFATYTHLVKKFGKDNIYIGTSNKTDSDKSPFNFKEKKEIITTMFGIQPSKIVEVKNPYRPVEILEKFNEDTTAFVTVVGEKDEARLGGKYFEKWKDGRDLEGYIDRGYIYVSPAQPNPISGTDVRINLGKNTDAANKMDFFTKRAYPKFNKKIYDLVTKKLAESYQPIHISKEVIEEWVATKFQKILKEISINPSSSVGKDVDDGPNFFFPNIDVFNKVSAERAEKLGMIILKQLVDKKFEDYFEHPIYPNGPVGAVTFFPRGVDNKQTENPSDDWFNHATRLMSLSGYSLVSSQTELENQLGINEVWMGYPSKEQLAQKHKELKQLRKKLDTHRTGDERYTHVNETEIKYIEKSLGVPRDEMPQIETKHIAGFLKFLKSKGVELEAKPVDVSDLKLTQGEINVEKVLNLMKNDTDSLDDYIVVSNDGYILDGHHRVVALYNLDNEADIRCIIVDVDIYELLELAFDYPKTEKEDIEGETITEDIIPGGVSQGMDIKGVANYHKVDLDDLMKELEMGIKVELEHTFDRNTAEEIALDHLYEDPKYYTHLTRIHKEYGFVGTRIYPPAPMGGLADDEMDDIHEGPKRGLYRGKMKFSGTPAEVEVELYGVDNKQRQYLTKVIHVDKRFAGRLPVGSTLPIPTKIFHSNWKKIDTSGQLGEEVLNENIIVNILIKAIASAGVVVVRAFLGMFIDRVINGAIRTYQDIKDIVAPEPYIKFLKGLEKNDTFNKQFIEFTIENRKGKNLLGNSWMEKITTLPAFVEEFDKFTKEEGIDGYDKTRLSAVIKKSMWDAYLRNWRGIYKTLKKKYPQFAKELPEGKLNEIHGTRFDAIGYDKNGKQVDIYFPRARFGFEKNIVHAAADKLFKSGKGVEYIEIYYNKHHLGTIRLPRNFTKGKDWDKLPITETPAVDLIQSEAQAVSGGKVHKYITGKNLTLKGKKYPDIEFEVLGIDNKLQLVKLKVLAPKSVFGQEMNVQFSTIRRGPFIKTNTNLTESQVEGGEPETGYIPDGKVRIVGSAGGRPEPWFEQGGYTQIDFPKSDAMRGKGKSKDKESSFRKVTYKTSNVKVSTLKKALKPVGSDEWPEVPLNEVLILEGGAYGHMSHPFDTEINLTFGQLKDIANRALDGKLELTREKTDGQALAVSWVGGKLVAARNKGHLANKGANALDIKGVATKFSGRGELEKAYNFAMNDLSNAVKALSENQREKIFKGGSCFMNLEVIYPTSVNVVPYGQALLVFHGTFEYDIQGNVIGENQDAARILAGMIKQVNQNVQSTYTIQGPPITKLPKSQDLSKLKGKYNGQISKLQSKFKLGDNAGIAEYHQAWWTEFITKNTPVPLDNNTMMGLVKRWAFYDKSFRLDAKNLTNPKVLEWAQKTDKDDHAKIAKNNIRPFEDIFLGVGSDVLSLMSSVLTANPDSAIRNMKDRLDKMISDVQKSGDEKLINKLKLELERLNAIGGKDKIVPNEGIVFVYNGNTFKLTGTFAPLNQILGMFYGK